MRLFQVSVCVAFLSSGIAQAATYYVATNGSDNNNGGTGSPWQTIGKANGMVQPGDTVRIRSGTYPGIANQIRPAISGASSQPITYTADNPNAKPIITGTSSTTRLSNGIDLTDRSYIVIDRIIVDGGAAWNDSKVTHWAILSGASCHNNVIQSCEFKYAKGQAGIEIAADSQYNKLMNNILDYCGTFYNPDDSNKHLSGDSLMVGSHNNLIEGNTLTHGGHNLLQVTGNGNIIRNNTLDNHWSDTWQGNPDRGYRPAAIRGESNVIEGNIVTGSLYSPVDYNSQTAMKIQGKGQIVRRNFIYDNFDDAISSDVRGTPEPVPDSTDSRIYNNVFYNNHGPAWFIRFYVGGNEINRHVYKNNIVYKNRQGDPLTRTAAGPDGPDAEITFNLNNQNTEVADIKVLNNTFVKESPGDAQIYYVDHNSDGGFNRSIVQIQSDFPSNFSANLEVVPQFVISAPESADDFKLTANNSALIDGGAHLTTTTSASTGTSLPVADARYFSAGIHDGTTQIAVGDSIQVGSNAPVQITAVNYDTNTITLGASITWGNGNNVSLPYVGTKPDIGAFEGKKAPDFISVAAHDGWILESVAGSGVGGTIDASATSTAGLRAGDKDNNRQYKSILSFDTSSLGSNASILSATLKLKRGTVAGANPFLTFGACRVDVKTGGFGGANALAAGDFEAAASYTQAATLSNAPNNGDISTATLSIPALAHINKTGQTQFRIYFATATDNDNADDYIGWYAADNGTASNRPVLEIVYQ